jgi:predicted TIM-barrel enzyme
MSAKPLKAIIAALQLPAFPPASAPSMSWYEDFLFSNASIFADAGVKAIKVQDETREVGAASERTVARMAALGRGFRKAFPEIELGIIVQAHDARAPLAIADAADADFIRLKVFVGAAVNAEGLRPGLGVEATQYREMIGRTDIAIYADVHDRTAHPLVPVAHETAALWAEGAGADAIVITGASFDDSLARVVAARQAGVQAPIVIGGGITEQNVGSALDCADAVVVSTALRREGAALDDMRLWDRDKILRLMEAAQPQ